MRSVILIALLFFLTVVHGQAPTIISGKIIDERGKPIDSAMLYYGKDNLNDDTAYSDLNGEFKISYPTPVKYKYYFYIEREGFLPKSISIDTSNVVIKIDTAVVLRSRKGFWYDSRQIDSTHLGMTFRQAVLKYKLDLNSCSLIQEPIRVIRGIRTELGDSSWIFLMTKAFYDSSIYKIENLLDSTIIGIGVADTKGNQRYYGRGFYWSAGIYNPYDVERYWKEQDEIKKKKQ